MCFQVLGILFKNDVKAHGVYDITRSFSQSQGMAQTAQCGSTVRHRNEAVSLQLLCLIQPTQLLEDLDYCLGLPFVGYKRKRSLVTKRYRESGSVLTDRLSYLSFCPTVHVPCHNAFGLIMYILTCA